MSKAAPRSQKGAEFDMREAAQEAARREGLSLGEWMARAISDQLGEQFEEKGGDDAEVRLEAVAAELARLSGEAPDAARVARASRRAPHVDRGPVEEESATRSEAGPSLAPPSAARAAFFESRVASVLAQIDIRLGDIERRLRRGERAALGALRDAIDALHDRLAEIETALSEKNLTGEDRPLRAMLVRLENRVEALSRQGRDEQGALSQLDARLQNLLETLSVGRPVALRGGVSDAIDAIAARQRALDLAARPTTGSMASRHAESVAERQAEPQAPRPMEMKAPRPMEMKAPRPMEMKAPRPMETTTPRPMDKEALRQTDTMASRRLDAAIELASARPRLDALSAKVAQMVGRLAERAPRAEVSALEQALGALSARIAASIASGAEPAPAALERLEGQIATLSERLDQAVAALQARDVTPWREISTRLDQLATRLDQPKSTNPDAVDSLSRRLDDLRTAVEARPMIDVAPVLAGLDQKIDALTERFDRDTGRAEEARNARDISDLRARSAASERLTQQSLSAVHETLEKVVDRLAMIEEDVVGARPAPSRAALSDIGENFLVEPGAGRPASSAQPAPAPQRAPQPTKKPAASPPLSVEAADRPSAAAPSQKPAASPKTSAPQKPSVPEVKAPAKNEAEIFPPVNYIEIARRALAARAASAAPKAEAGAAASRPEQAAAGAAPSRFSGWRGPATMCAALMVASFAGWQVLHPATTESADKVADAFARINAAAAADAAPSINLQQRAAASSPVALAPDMAPTGSIDSQISIARRQASYAPVPSPSSVGASGVGMPTVGTSSVAPPNGRAPSNDIQAQYDLGVRLAEGRGQPQDLTAARAAFEKAADAGFAPAQYRLGALYEKGVLGPGDPQIAVDYYRKAAMQGHVRAMHNLAVAMAEGVGGKPDYTAAAQWFRRAAEYGLRDSQYNIAVLYGRGLGAPQDYGQSYMWFALAAAQGDDEAARKRDELTARLSPPDLAQARKAVADFRAKTPDPVINGQSLTAASSRSPSRG